ncbi:hypothetical protein O9992_04510 [Vibrio lentus]|nr:hypothetical protein [Vibrio lentus]
MGREADFDALVPFEDGDTYNGNIATSLEEGVKRILGESGYAYPQVRTIPEFDDETKRVSLVINVEAGSRIYSSLIFFTGNNSTKDEVLRHEKCVKWKAVGLTLDRLILVRVT